MRTDQNRVTRRVIAAGLLGVVSLAFAGCGDDETDAADDTTEETTGSTDATTPAPTTPAPNPDTAALAANLSGAEEVPGPGVTDGVGTVEVTFQGTEVCYDMSVTMGETPTAAHIHGGAKGTAGKVVVDLKPSFTRGESAFLDQDCVAADAATLTSLKSNPSGFYVNVHTAEHKDGAVRGQLAGPAASSAPVSPDPASGASTTSTSGSGGGTGY